MGLVLSMDIANFMLTTTFILNIGYGHDFRQGDFTQDDMLDSAELLCSVSDLIADCIIAIFSMVMFLRLIYSRRFRNPVSANEDQGNAILKKYEAV